MTRLTARRLGSAATVVLLGTVVVSACGASGGTQSSENMSATSSAVPLIESVTTLLEDQPVPQPCDEIWRDGANIAEIDGRSGCLQDGELTHHGTGGQLCDDGSNIGFNAVAWWGPDGVIHRFDVGQVPAWPEGLLEACKHDSP